MEQITQVTETTQGVKNFELLLHTDIQTYMFELEYTEEKLHQQEEQQEASREQL